MNSIARTALTAVISSLLTMSLVAGCEVVKPLAGLLPGPTASPQSVATSSAEAPTQRPSDARPALAQPVPQSGDIIPRVYQDASPSVVNIVSIGVGSDFFSQPAPQPLGAGSGFIIDDKGHIITNNHVVEDAQRLDVTLADGTTVAGKLIGRDPRADLAVVKVDVPADKLRIAKLGDASKVQIGELAIAIGNPFGLEKTVTAGIVSATRRAVNEPGADGILIQAIQTDASINPGNSGGPLFNARGEVIGVNTLILSPGAGPGGGGNIGIGFAQSIDYAKRVVPALISGGKFAHPFIGVGTVGITEAIAQELQLQVKNGLVVGSVDQGSGAARAGIRAGTRQTESRSRRLTAGGDVLTAIDGQPLRTSEDLVAYLEMNKSPGDTVTLSIVRDGQNLQVPVQLTERPAPR